MKAPASHIMPALVIALHSLESGFLKELWRLSCDLLAGGASERAMSVGPVLMEQLRALLATWQRNVSSFWGWVSAVKSLRGPQNLPTGQGLFEDSKAYFYGLLYFFLSRKLDPE